MNRLPEPELMKDPHQVKAYADADFSESDNSFVNRIDEYLLKMGRKLDSKSLIIDLGCGPGNITERMRRRWPSVRILGIDGSEAMLAIARSRINEEEYFEGVNKINYCCLNISSILTGSLNLEISADLIVSNSLLHHLHDPSQFWKAINFLSNQGTVHLHRDLRRPLTDDQVSRLQKIYLPDAPDVLVRDYLASLKAAFTVKELREQIQSEQLDHLSVHEVEDRYLEVVGIF